MDETLRAGLEQRFAAWSQQGFRVLGVASRRVPEQSAYTAAEEQRMTFEGFLLFADPPKAGVRETLDRLAALGVQVKVITGDNRLVAVHVAEQVGMHAPRVLTGQEINQLKDEAFWHRAARTDLFVEVDPSQKERIILTLRHAGHVVGYLGDGINDAPALYAADAGISVDTAVDVAKEAADFVLLGPDLEVLRQGIEYGRTTFANTLKYIYMTTSPTSATWSAWPLPRCSCLSCRCWRSRFCSTIFSPIFRPSASPPTASTVRRWIGCIAGILPPCAVS